MTLFPRKLTRPLLTLMLLSMLGACSWFNRPAPYADSRSAGVLKVPDRLDQPGTDPALSVPEMPVRGELLARDGQSPPEIGEPGVLTSPEEAAAALAAAVSFPVEDSLESTFRRVGQALERADYEILARDAERGIYRVVVVTQSNAEGRWWKFWQRAREERAEYVVQVAADGGRTKVTVLDGAGQQIASAQSGLLLAELKSGLAGS